MVQLKYFGDYRDFFKYDLITSVVAASSLNKYVFVPMLTEHRFDNEGKKAPRYAGGKSKELLTFINRCPSKSLTHWEKWLSSSRVDSYETINPPDTIFFSDDEREQYWRIFKPLLGRENALVFLDPDTGLETGTPSYLSKMGREKYILDKETEFLYKQLESSSLLMIYQHLPNNKNIHLDSVRKKLSQLQSASGGSLVCAYREDDLAFLFLSKDPRLFDELCNILNAYHVNSHHKLKSLHLPSSYTLKPAPEAGAVLGGSN